MQQLFFSTSTYERRAFYINLERDTVIPFSTRQETHKV